MPTSNTLFFYAGDKLVSLVEGDQARSILRHDSLALAELPGSTDGKASQLLQTDLQGSVIGSLEANSPARADG